MSKLFTALEDFLKKEDWKFRVNNEEDILLEIEGDNGSYKGSFFVEEPRIVFYFMVPYNIPMEKRAAICEFLCRANYGLALGNFEMDMERGDVNYKTTLVWEEENAPSYETLARMVFMNVEMLDKYFKGINAVVYGEVDPKKAIEEIENVEDSD